MIGPGFSTGAAAADAWTVLGAAGLALLVVGVLVAAVLGDLVVRAAEEYARAWREPGDADP